MNRRWLVPIVIVVAVLVGVGVWLLVSAGRTPRNVVALSGRIEGDDSAIAPKTPGRITAIYVQEGDSVKAGQVIATLDDSEIRAQEDQARAAVAAAQARADAAAQQTAVLQAELRGANLMTQQAGTDIAGHVAQAESEVAAAQSLLAQQQAQYRLAAANEKRVSALYGSGDVSGTARDQAVSNAQQAAAAVEAARKRVQSAQDATVAVKAGLANPAIRNEQALSIEGEIASQQSAIAAARAQERQALGALAQAQASVNDLTIRAPFSGTVMVRAAEPGEVVPAGTAIVTLLNLDRVYLRGFVPEGQIGKIKLGQPAHIFLDSDPSRAIDAYVLRIDPQATFTPENTYFRDDRVKQVFGIKLALKSGFGFAKPGMPADGEILVNGSWPGNRRG
ncbi:MAG TPA: HlyD family efflux transporter periplasmic adaptor subunit [Candidatus Tumulicola sp.]|nr:HlyD family efflux transporter periplasmic adaptor subunit [Candidatus Tumulicola sp.]